ncbi:hypothetical protein Tco_0073404 [Tanacetum coccineum]
MENGLAIHMLTEKKYPLSQELLSKMLSKKLEIDHESSQAFELLRRWPIISITASLYSDFQVELLEFGEVNSTSSLKRKKEMQPSGIICIHKPTTLKVLNHEQGVNNKGKKTKHFFHTGMITKDMFNWKMEDGKKYDEVKQYKAFSDTMKNEFKKDDEVKKLKDLEMIVGFSFSLMDGNMENVQRGESKELEPGIPNRGRGK